MAEEELRAVAKREAEELWGPAPERASQASTAEPLGADPQKKYPKPGYKGRFGKGQSWSANESWWKQGQRNQQQDEEAKMDPATVELIKAVTKMCIRHEEELGRLRTETNFMCFCDVDGEKSILPAMKRAASNWQEAYAAGTVTSSLRVVLFQGLLQIFQRELQKVLEEEELRTRLLRVGWTSEGVTALTPVWHYYKWDAESRTSVKAERPPLTHEQVQECVAVLLRTTCQPGVLLRFRSTRPLGTQQPSEVAPFLLSIGLRGNHALEAHTALSHLSDNGACKLLAMRIRPERLAKSAQAKAVEEAYLQTSFTDWTRRTATWSIGADAATRS